ncbi:hypothetical protein ACJX0J_038920, partial [Zea mays]
EEPTSALQFIVESLHFVIHRQYNIRVVYQVCHLILIIIWLRMHKGPSRYRIHYTIFKNTISIFNVRPSSPEGIFYNVRKYFPFVLEALSHDILGTCLYISMTHYIIIQPTICDGIYIKYASVQILILKITTIILK